MGLSREKNLKSVDNNNNSAGAYSSLEEEVVVEGVVLFGGVSLLGKLAGVEGGQHEGEEEHDEDTEVHGGVSLGVEGLAEEDGGGISGELNSGD